MSGWCIGDAACRELQPACSGRAMVTVVSDRALAACVWSNAFFRLVVVGLRPWDDTPVCKTEAVVDKDFENTVVRE